MSNLIVLHCVYYPFTIPTWYSEICATFRGFPKKMFVNIYDIFNIFILKSIANNISNFSNLYSFDAFNSFILSQLQMMVYSNSDI